MKDKVYLCIDLKCFFASVECVERNLDPFTTDLVVADKSRGNGALCLAISPSLKAKGVKNRCRIFEIPKQYDYIIAKPRMKKYIEYSANIYSIYLKYVSSEDILVYSIDECFLDITSYLKLYKMDERKLAKLIIDDVYKQTNICATVGIGTNMFLAKVALDIISKTSDDHIGYLSQEIFKEKIWHYRPITDIWNIGKGISNRLEKYGVYDLHGIAMMEPEILYKEFGVNAEFLIDHSNGIEPCSIKQVHNYVRKNNSMSNSQILFEDYDYINGLLVLKEMVELNVLELVDKHLVTNGIALHIRYSKDIIKPLSVSCLLNEYTSSYSKLNGYFVNLYNKHINKNYPIRQVGIVFLNVLDESYATYNLFTDFEKEDKERKMQEAILQIKRKYGKNAILKGMNLQEKATTRKRNTLIGGHNGE